MCRQGILFEDFLFAEYLPSRHLTLNANPANSLSGIGIYFLVGNIFMLLVMQLLYISIKQKGEICST